jgi:hypothetical protein
MKALEREQLTEQLARYGYELLKPSPSASGEQVLARLARQDEVRLLEAFPVVLARLLHDRQALDWESKRWKPSDDFSPPEEKRLAFLLAASFWVLTSSGLTKHEKRLRQLLRKFKQGPQFVESLGPLFESSETLRMDGLELSAERLKNSFRLYHIRLFKNEQAEKKRQALQFDLLLSELFTTRQKELLRKKYLNEPMTKTEKEYFYRVLKKRLKALAHAEIHQFARRLV